MRQIKIKLLIITIFTLVSTSPLATAEIPLPHVPRLSAKAAMALVRKGVKYVIIDSATFGNAHVCGATFISYTWVPPWSKKPKIKVKIPKDYYIFVY